MEAVEGQGLLVYNGDKRGGDQGLFRTVSHLWCAVALFIQSEYKVNIDVVLICGCATKRSSFCQYAVDSVDQAV